MYRDEDLLSSTRLNSTEAIRFATETKYAINGESSKIIVKKGFLRFGWIFMRLMVNLFRRINVISFLRKCSFCLGDMG